MPDDAGTAGPHAARADAVALLREALPEVRALEPPRDALVATAASLRAGLARGG